MKLTQTTDMCPKYYLLHVISQARTATYLHGTGNMENKNYKRKKYQ